MRDRMRGAMCFQFTIVLLSLSSLIGPFTSLADAERDEPVHDTFSPGGYGQQDGGNDTRLFQYRSMWLEGYQIINHSEVLKVVETARSSNVNCLSPLINGNYLGVFYNSSYHPRFSELAWDFDPLMDLIREAHKYGIHVMPWFHTLIDPIVLREHPEWGCVSSSGYRSPSWLNPTLPEVQSYLANVTGQLMADYPLDGIKLDTIRYPGSNYGYDEYSIQIYYEENWTDFNAFRRQQITECMMAISDAINEVRPYAWIGADIFTNSYSRQYSIFQDSELWSQTGLVDFVTPMTYTTSFDTYRQLIDLNIDQHSCPVVAGTYVYVPGNTAHGSVPNETVGIETMNAQVNYALSSNALGVCLFSYKFLRSYPSYGQALVGDPFEEYASCPLKNQTTAVTDLKWDFEHDQDREGWRLTDSGHHYPRGGRWTIANSKEAGLMSPLLGINAKDINVIEIDAAIDDESCFIDVYWSNDHTRFSEPMMVRTEVMKEARWGIVSIHLDDHPEWLGNIRYIRVVPRFEDASNITIGSIHLSWMPYSVRTWLSAGTFFTGHSKGLLERTFFENEAEIVPRAGTITGGRPWTDATMDRDLIDLDLVYGHTSYSVAYSHMFVISPRDMDVQMRIGSSDAIKVWINGEVALVIDEERDVGPDQNTTMVSLKHGINRVLLKIVVLDHDMSFFLRFTTQNNRTVEDLRYHSDIPPPSTPQPYGAPEGWTSSDPVDIIWDPIEGLAGISFYEWRLNGGDISVTDSTVLTMEGLVEGEHLIEVRAVDEFGSRSEFGRVELCLDRSNPRISTPDAGSSIITQEQITWRWKETFVPVSGIKGSLATLLYDAGNGNRGVVFKNIMVNGTSFTYQGSLTEGCRYTLKLTVESNAGLSTEEDSVPVLVDLNAPTAPSQTMISVRNNTNLEYNISWKRSMDLPGSGIDHYEVWSLRGPYWEMTGTTDRNWTWMRRDPGRTISIKVRAVDRAGHVGGFSAEISSSNMAPIPVITGNIDCYRGGSLELSSSGSFDADGWVMGTTWSLDGVNISNLPSISLTLDPGHYRIGLWVSDDHGIFSYAETHATVSTDLNTGLARDLTDLSKVDVFLPPIENVTVTQVVIIAPPDDANRTSIEEVQTASSLLLASIFSLLVMSFLVTAASIAILIIRYRRGPKNPADAEDDEFCIDTCGDLYPSGTADMGSRLRILSSNMGGGPLPLMSRYPSMSVPRVNDGSSHRTIHGSLYEDVMEMDEDLDEYVSMISAPEDVDDPVMDMIDTPDELAPKLEEEIIWDEEVEFEELLEEDIEWSDGVVLP
ncbi:MAG: family 10 glycosylhydrolase [Candidatus Thermoplasmatota archaeon]|nr:family 10 glycosylhydrolase [Candidatus Thermoplasmatota archaeon]